MLGVNLEIAVARRPVSQARLTPSEASQFAQVAGPRQDSWLRGRAALKTLLSQVMGEEDTSTLAFPSHWVSLTHSSECTVAVASPLCVMGVGVDLEVARLPRPESARFFLAASERVAGRGALLGHLFSPATALDGKGGPLQGGPWQSGPGPTGLSSRRPTNVGRPRLCSVGPAS